MPPSTSPATDSPASRGRRRRLDRGAYWRSERLVFCGDEYFAELLDDFAKARHSIDFETYIFYDDVIGQRVEAALTAAAERGVTVRLLVDGVGAGLWIRRRVHLPQDHVQVRVYHPPPWLIFPRAFRGRSHSWRMTRLAIQINRRNHRKVAVIDGRIAWVGSVNVSADHSREVSHDHCWRDTAARVEGAAVAALVDAYNQTWRRSWRLLRNQLRPPNVRRTQQHEYRGPLVRLNSRFPARRRRHQELLARIANAKHRVWLTNAYFIPYRRLLVALRSAARRGVDVRILVPAKSDILFMPWLAAAFYRPLLDAGVRMFEYQPSMLHAKTVHIDDWLTVGSTNLNYRSLLHDLEADVVLLHPRTQRAMERAFHEDLACSREVSPQDWRTRSWCMSVVSCLLLRLRWWF